MACAAAQKDFCSYSLVALPLGLSFGFGPTFECAPLSGVCSPPRREGEKAAADWGTLRLRRGMAVKFGVCANCLWQRRPAGSCNRLGHSCSGGSPSQCPTRQRLVCVGGGDPTSCKTLNSGTSFLRQTRLLVGSFPATEPLSPIPSVVSMQPTPVLFPDLIY